MIFFIESDALVQWAWSVEASNMWISMNPVSQDPGQAP